MDNALLDLHNSSDDTKAEFNSSLLLHLACSLKFKTKNKTLIEDMRKSAPQKLFEISIAPINNIDN